jgi:glycosyltransferase involved in cell wall biosynthesis
VRVLFLTHYYPPERGAAPARIAALAHGLAERGVEVVVHTGFPHYPSGAVTPPYRNRPLAIEREGRVRVVRSLVYPTPNRGVARRLADHAVFAASALASASASGPIDVVVAESPPLFTAAAGVGYAARKRAALALNISDLWPESAIELGALRAGGRSAAAAHALARLCYRRSALITAPTAGIVATLDARPEASGKVVHVPPAVDLERFAGVPEIALPAVDVERFAHAPETAPRTPAPPPPPHGVTDEPSVAATSTDEPADAVAGTPTRAPLRVLYAGTLGLAQGLSTLLDAAALAGPEVVELSIAGEGPEGERLRTQIAARRLVHVRLLGSVSPQEICALYATADAGVVPLRDLPIFAGALPTKLFEILAAGRPAIVAARGEAAALVRDAGSGLAVAPEDPHALAAAFRRLQGAPAEARAMGARGRAHVHRFDRTAIVAQWHALLTRLTAARP